MLVAIIELQFLASVASKTACSPANVPSLPPSVNIAHTLRKEEETASPILQTAASSHKSEQWRVLQPQHGG